MFEALTDKLCCIRKGKGVFLWNRFTGDSIILTQDLIEDYFEGKSVNCEYTDQLKALELDIDNSSVSDKISIEAVSVYFDSGPCENSCKYCISPAIQRHEKKLSFQNIILFIKQNFPKIKAINVTGPDNKEKYAFVKFIRGHFETKISINININQIEQVCEIPNIDILAGGSLTDFLKTPLKKLNGLNAYIVLPNSNYDYNKILRLIAALPFQNLTVEHDFLDTTINVEEYCSFLLKLQNKCNFDVSGFWEKPVLNINKNIKEACKSYEGKSLSIHDTGHVSICGYLKDDSSIEISAPLLNKDSFLSLLNKKSLKAVCKECHLLGICKGGCRILHSDKNIKAFEKQCEIKKTYFQKWAIEYISQNLDI